MKYTKSTLLVFVVLFSTILHAQDEDFVYEDRIYDDRIKSAQIYIQNQPAIVPIIGLKTGFTSFTMMFDELAEDADNFYYKVVHCDRNWKASDLDEIHYIEGFNGEEIQDYSFSTNTYVDYVYFSLTIPNADIKFRLSGNYVLIIYDDADLTHPVITKRFMVSENIAKVDLQLTRTLDATLKNTHHQLLVTTDNGGNAFADPMSDFSIDIIQNNRWDNMLTNLKPVFYLNKTLNFNNSGKIIFPAGKEFRIFDFRSLNYTTQFVQNIELNKDGSAVYLVPEKNRRFSNYLYEKDFDGRYLVQTFDKPSNSIGLNTASRFTFKNHSDDFIRADYSDVIFTLKSNEVLEEIYVVGSFNNWRLDEDFKMSYVDKAGYRLATKLKQGFYNYLFAVKDREGKSDTEYFEGNSHETLNYYTAILYVQDPRELYDRIIGTTQIVGVRPTFD